MNMPEFNYWLLVPETDLHYSFLKEICVDRHTCKKTLESRGMKLFPLCGKIPNGISLKIRYKNDVPKE